MPGQPHTFEAEDGGFSITLDRKNITITPKRQLTVADIEELRNQLYEVETWAMADRAYNRATYGNEDGPEE